MAVTVQVAHSCGHVATVVSPGPLDPEGLIAQDAVHGMRMAGVARRPCAACAARSVSGLPSTADLDAVSAERELGVASYLPCAMYMAKDGQLFHCRLEDGHAADHEYQLIRGTVVESFQTPAIGDFPPAQPAGVAPAGTEHVGVQTAESAISPDVTLNTITGNYIYDSLGK